MEPPNPRSFRSGLLLAVPERRGFFVAIALLVVVIGLFAKMNWTVENLLGAEPDHSFDTVLFLGMLLLMSATAWGGYRMVVAWHRLQQGLGRGSPRRFAALQSLVAKHGISTSLGLWRTPMQARVKPVVAHGWRHLVASRAAITDETLLAKLPDAPLLLTHRARARLVAELTDKLPEIEVLDDAYEVDAKGDGPLRAWVGAAHLIVAAELVKWTRWCLRHLQTLAFFLLVSLVLTTGLLWAYPFHPQSLLRIAFLLLNAGVAAVLTYVVVEMGRNPVLAHMAKADSDKGGWDRTFVSNVITYSVLTILTLVMSQVPGVGSTMFAWLEPLLRTSLPAR